MGTFRNINICFDLYSCFISLLIVFSIFINRNRDKTDSDFTLTCFTGFVLSFSDFFTIILEQNTSTVAVIAMRIAEFIFYECGILICTVYIKFLLNFLRPKENNIIQNSINISILVIFSLFLIVTQYTPFYYEFDDNNVYHRADFYWVSIACQMIIYVLGLLIIFGKKSHIKLYQKLTLASFAIFPFITHALQILFYGFSFVSTGITLSFFVIFTVLNDRLEISVKKRQNAILENEVRILKVQENSIYALSNLVENRDSDTGNHVKRTSLYVNLLATACAKKGIYADVLTEKYIALITKAAPLHDIGKIVVPDYILKKPGKLTDEEFDIMKKHTTEGKRIVAEVLGLSNDLEYVKITSEIATCHHEKWNGMGYPYKILGEEIPLSARIMAVADVFDALVSPRCYKPPFSIEKAFEILTTSSGTQFDPQLIPVFIEQETEIRNIMSLYTEEVSNE